jgi:hypothetical protein
MYPPRRVDDTKPMVCAHVCRQREHDAYRGPWTILMDSAWPCLSPPACATTPGFVSSIFGRFRNFAACRLNVRPHTHRTTTQTRPHTRSCTTPVWCGVCDRAVSGWWWGPSGHRGNVGWQQGRAYRPAHARKRTRTRSTGEPSRKRPAGNGPGFVLSAVCVRARGRTQARTVGREKWNSMSVR